MNQNETVKFNVDNEREKEVNRIIFNVYEALNEKGYNPINQIVGYILSGDPTYITSHKNARSMIRRIERDELLEELVKNYLKNKQV
ncbi:MAG: IreB family regulatory phosphoprotein [Firmicutes bacterium]|nr:IreB family regulatory phosphoprotein [Bacillota bacterium]